MKNKWQFFVSLIRKVVDLGITEPIFQHHSYWISKYFRQHLCTVKNLIKKEFLFLALFLQGTRLPVIAFIRLWLFHLLQLVPRDASDNDMFRLFNDISSHFSDFLFFLRYIIWPPGRNYGILHFVSGIIIS